MNRLDRANLGHIEHAYFSKRSPAQRGRELLVKRGRNRKYLRKLLRHHDEKPISDAETWHRDRIDYLLGYYSMVEIACLAGFLPATLPPKHRRQARAELGNPAVRAYYEDHYPLVLPRLHLERCEAPSRALSPGTSNGVSDFERFFALTRPIEFGEPVETFLWFLDGGWRGGYDIEDTVNAIGRPRKFLRCVSRTAGPRDHLAKSVQGFTIFLGFCRDLYELLGDTCDAPLIQSAMWHYHGYWFDHMRDRFGSQMRKALRQFERWEGKSSTANREERALRQEAREERADLQMIIAKLTSGRYGWTLREVASWPALKKEDRSRQRMRSR